MEKKRLWPLLGLFGLWCTPAMADTPSGMPAIAGISLEFVIFAITLLCVALFHRITMWIAISGLIVLLISKWIFVPDFSLFTHFIGTPTHEGEWRITLNLIGLLFGFGILAKHFELSRVPDILPRYLPDDWKGGFVLLILIFIISAFLDNIAAAMIGGAIAYSIFKGNVHIGYIAAIVAASNAGGSGSVVGDTTTTLMWIDGVNPMHVLHAYVAAVVALIFCGIIASLQQDRHQRITKDAPQHAQVQWTYLWVAILILVGAIITNSWLDFPAIGVWIAILLGALFVKTPWSEIKNSLSGTIFLVSLVTCASLMPVDQLPPASWSSALILGFVSAVFDNIPLTKLCLEQGGYDWGFLAYAVGFGGSMLWFGSSAGVAITGIYPKSRSVIHWVRDGWHVTAAYLIGFFVLLMVMGWHPHAPHRQTESLTQASLDVNPQQ